MAEFDLGAVLVQIGFIGSIILIGWILFLLVKRLKK